MHTDQDLLSDSFHPLQKTLEVIMTLYKRAKKKHPHNKERHLKAALKTWAYPKWTFNKTASRSGRRTTDRAETQKRDFLLHDWCVQEAKRDLWKAPHTCWLQTHQHPETETRPQKSPVTKIQEQGCQVNKKHESNKWRALWSVHLNELHTSLFAVKVFGYI